MKRFFASPDSTAPGSVEQPPAASGSAVQPAGLISDARGIQPVSAARPALQLSSSKALEAARRLQSASGSAEQPASAGPSTDSGCESESAAGDDPAWTPYRQDLGLGLGLRPVPKKIALDLWPKSMCWTCGREDCESQAECGARELALSDERMEEWEEAEKKEQEEREKGNIKLLRSHRIKREREQGKEQEGNLNAWAELWRRGKDIQSLLEQQGRGACHKHIG